jgi:hypothetical protein
MGENVSSFPRPSAAAEYTRHGPWCKETRRVSPGMETVVRERLLKPSFFLNEQLAKLPALTRIFFQGLWCEADREGRLEDRPERLKAKILPYDLACGETMLRELAEAQMVLRWTSDEGQMMVQIITFKKHQRPHPKEAPSIIPSPYAIKKPRKSSGETPASNCLSSGEQAESNALSSESSESSGKERAAPPPVSLRVVGSAPRKDIDAVFAEWTEMATAVSSLCPPPMDRAAEQVITRALGAHSPGDLSEAMHGAAISRWHMTHGYWQLRHILKDSGTITGHRDRWVKFQARAASVSRR